MKVYRLNSILQEVPINEELYPSTSLKELSKDIQDLADLFSGKIKCQVKQVYTGDPIIDQIPMSLIWIPDPDMFSCPEWLKDHNRAIRRDSCTRPLR